MKILLLTQVLPYPPDSGPKVKTLNMLKYLCQHHEVTLVSFVRGDQSSAAGSLRRYCRAVYTVPIERAAAFEVKAFARSLRTGKPWLILRDDRLEMREMVKRVAAAEHFDIVQADQMNMAQYAELANGPLRVIDTHNALWLLYRRLAATMPVGPRRLLFERDWRLMKRYEGRICRDFDAVAAVSEEDKSALIEAGGDPEKFTVMPIAVDSDELTPVVPLAGANHILHIGTMYWPPNIDGILWFIREVFPLIHLRRSDVIFDVVGARPPASITSLSGDATGINVTGYVEDTLPYLENAAAFVVPLRSGGGMRVKILNAMAQAIPVVSTTIGCEGIAVKDGQHLLVADTPDAFARAVLMLLENRALAHQIGENARKLVLSRYDYRAACQPYEELYRAHHDNH